MDDSVYIVLVKDGSGYTDVLVYERSKTGFGRAMRYAQKFEEQGRLIGGPYIRSILCDERNG